MDMIIAYVLFAVTCLIGLTIILSCATVIFLAMESTRHDVINFAKKRGVGKTGMKVVTFLTFLIYPTLELAIFPAFLVALLWPPASWFTPNAPVARRPVKPAAKMQEPTPRSPFPPLSGSSRRFLQGGRR